MIIFLSVIKILKQKERKQCSSYVAPGLLEKQEICMSLVVLCILFYFV